MATISSSDIDPFDPTFLADPFAHHDALREAGPVVWLERYGCYAMARYAEVKTALNNWQHFVSSRGVGLADFAIEAPWRPPSLLLEADPPLHERTRGIMNKVASLAGLRALVPTWYEQADDLVAGLPDGKAFDSVVQIAEAFPLRIFPALIGLRDEGHEHLIPYATSVFNAFGPSNELLADSLAAAADASAWVNASCKRSALKPGGWGAAVFAAVDRGDCSEDEAERLVRSFLSAGVDTTVNGIANLIYALAANPAEWRRLKAQPQLAKKAIEESLRWGGVIQTFFRTTSADVEIGGATIPANAKVILFLAAANRDPRQWDAPEAFRIDRNVSGHVGFGFGIHQCLGQMVARLEMEAVLGALLAQCRSVELTAAPARRPNNTLFAFDRLELTIDKQR